MERMRILANLKEEENFTLNVLDFLLRKQRIFQV